MIMKFFLKIINVALTPLFAILDLAGVDITAVTNAAASIIPYVASGWAMLKKFCPTLDACLALAGVCVAFETIYKLYLFVLWVLKKIPVISVS